MTRHPEEGALHAYIDGELLPTEAAALEAHVAVCAECTAALAEARGFVAAASRAINALDSAPASAAPVRPAQVAAPASRAPRRAIYQVPFARAAALLLLAGGTAVVVGKSGTMSEGKSSPVAAVTAEGALAKERAMVPAPTAMTRAEPVSAPPEARDLSPTGAAAREGAVAQKAAPNVRQSDFVAQDAAAEGRLAASPLATSARIASGGQVDRVGASPTIATAFPAPPPAAAAAPSVARRESATEAVALSAANPSATRITRLRTREGVVLTLTDEPLRTSFAQETAAAAQRPARAMNPAAAAPAVNSYRWSNPTEGRTFTLTGPLPVTELEAASKRLAELEKVP